MAIPRISKAQLDQLYLQMQDKDVNLQQASVYLGLGVIMHMLGEKWMHHYVSQEAKFPNMLTLTSSGGEIEAARQLRLGDLAEVLFNLQNVPGFDECVERLKAGDIEATLAELDLGRFLYLHSVTFRYVVPISKKGSDYDVEITYPNGVTACADAKCKVEGEFNARTIEHSLETARKQLPKDKPGIVFVKHPAAWAKENFAELRDLTHKFFRRTKRIVSVVFYVQPFERRGDQLLHQHGHAEFSNPGTRFGNNIDWNLFPVGYLKNLQVPDHWQQILHYGGREPE
ncbi:hypothetical protein [Bradyrhizobium sp. NC92]|uniref:hypothetical protein n=1 Tax=Bradyrhizobium sp. (strain NC92) TaxID=55395 RepID=UPI0021AA4D9A|nr:hypothetical protein [Bradyrhizobium sp. NC92]UWU66105.1 hypothetical protein N2602_22915 [Bradyrhizobium sp. NC92]